MAGKLILVSGFSGAGKTTLVGAALLHVPNLHYLRTITTRPPRSDESESFEYAFVSDAAYEVAKSQSASWDHSEYSGYKYGANIDDIKLLLSTGDAVISTVIPDLAVIKTMGTLYGCKPETIWVDTPYEVAKARISHDKNRYERVETAANKRAFDYVFDPSGDLDKDAARFTELIKQL